MPRLIKTLRDGSSLEYDTGKFDDWCVYHRVARNSRLAVTDLRVFSDLHVLGALLGSTKLYQLFVEVYDRTDHSINDSVLSYISEKAEQFGSSAADLEQVLSILYAGMVAEENKDRAILKKRIKRLGVHQVLIEQRTPVVASNYSRGLKADELKIECSVRGF